MSCSGIGVAVGNERWPQSDVLFHYLIVFLLTNERHTHITIILILLLILITYNIIAYICKYTNLQNSQLDRPISYDHCQHSLCSEFWIWVRMSPTGPTWCTAQEVVVPSVHQYHDSRIQIRHLRQWWWMWPGSPVKTNSANKQKIYQ